MLVPPFGFPLLPSQGYSFLPSLSVPRFLFPPFVVSCVPLRCDPFPRFFLPPSLLKFSLCFPLSFQHPPVGPKLRRARRALVVESDPILKARLQRLQQARENYEVPSALLPPTAVKTDSSALKATGSTAAAPSPLPAGAHVVPTAVAVQAALQQLLEASQARATAEKEMRSSKRFSSAKVEGDGEDGKAPFDAVSGIGLHRPYELGLAAMASNQPGGMSPMGLAQPRAKWVAPPPPPVEEGTENTEGEEGAALEEGAAAASEGSEEAAKAEGAKQE